MNDAFKKQILSLVLALTIGIAGAVGVLFTAPSWAKDKKPEKEKIADYSLIAGSVFRDDGFSLRGAKVTCRRSTDKKAKWETYSSEAGEFAFRLPVGKMKYVVTAELKGFEPASKAVQIENNERQDISIVLPAKKP